MRLQQNRIQSGWDIILIARQPIRSANYHEIEAACARLLGRAQLFQTSVAHAAAKDEESKQESVAESNVERNA